MCGGYVFSKSLPRSFLAIGSCADRCFKSSEIAGLITSAAISRAPFTVPSVVLESDTCVAIRHPKAEWRIHYVLFPKHDTRNIATLTPEDAPYLLGCMAMVRALVEKDHLQAYRLQTNGPKLQEIAYLHFHLIAP
jgi:diadenosine tetraphosphate (Ap4A) HIT family hydrolase